MTRGDPSSIGDIFGTNVGHWAVAQEDRSFFALRLYHAAGGRQDWKHLHRAIMRGELDKAAKIPRNEKSDAAYNVQQSVSRITPRRGIHVQAKEPSV